MSICSAEYEFTLLLSSPEFWGKRTTLGLMLTPFQDITKYGEAPVRQNLSGPDRDRYMSDSSQNPPKTSSSSRSGHSHVHLPGHNHRHNKSNDDARSLRPSISREDSGVSGRQINTRAPTTTGTAWGNSSSSSLVQRPVSPTPSGRSNWSQATSKTTMKDGDARSPTNGNDHKQRHLLSLGRFLKSKDKDSKTPSRLKELPGSLRSFNPPTSKPEHGQEPAIPRIWPMEPRWKFFGLGGNSRED